MDHYIILFGFLLLLIGSTFGIENARKEVEIIEKILQDYSNRIRPAGLNGTKGPTIVFINFNVQTFEYIDDIKMEFAVRLDFQQQWNDDRLAYNITEFDQEYVSLSKEESKKIWIPDLFFSNENSMYLHDILTRNNYVHVYPDGDVFYSIRISLTLACPMNLRNFPFDKQTCSIRMSSYSQTANNIFFKWKDEESIIVPSELNLPRFTLEKFENKMCDLRTSTGVYSCLLADFVFQRELSYYLVQIYIPTTSIVIISWLSFWLGKNEVIGRLLITLITYLMMIITCLFLNLTLPGVSYTKSVDVWNGCCLTFVFLALLEFIFVYFLARAEEINNLRINNIKGGQNGIEQQNIIIKGWTLPDKIDIFARALYPVGFFIFAWVYVAVYPTSSVYVDWND